MCSTYSTIGTSPFHNENRYAMTFGGIWFQRRRWEYDIFSGGPLRVWYTLSAARWEHDTLSAVIIAAVTIATVTVNITVSVAAVTAVVVAATNIKSAATSFVTSATAIVATISAAAFSWLLFSATRWEYDTLSAALDACCASQEARRIEARLHRPPLPLFWLQLLVDCCFFPLLLSPPPLSLFMLFLPLSLSPLSPSPSLSSLLSSLQSSSLLPMWPRPFGHLQ